MTEVYKEVQQASVKGRLKFLLKDSVIYGGVSSISKFLHVFLLPILARLLTKEDYGIYDTLLMISAFALVIIISGTDSAIARFFYDTKDLQKQKNIVSEVLIFEIIMSIVVVVVLWFFSDKILLFYFRSTDFLLEIRLILISIPFIILVRFTQNLLKWLYKRKEFILISVGSVSTTMILSIFFILYIKPEIKFLFYAQLISMGLFSILGIILCRKYIHIPQKINTLIPQLKFGIPLSANQLLTSVIPLIDRYFIATLLGPALLGVYAVGNKVSQISQMAINGFQVAWGPLAYSIMNEDNSKKTYAKVYNYYLLFTSIFILFFVFFTPLLIVFLATKSYAQAEGCVFILLLSKMILSITGITAIGLGLSKKTKYYLIASSVRLIVVVISVYFLIPILSFTGAALAILLGSICYSIIISYFSNKKHSLSFNFKNGSILLISTIILSYFILYFDSWVVKFFILVCSLLLVLIFAYFYIIDNEDRTFWKKHLRIEV